MSGLHAVIESDDAPLESSGKQRAKMQGTYTVDQIRTILGPVFRSHGVRRAVLFGSYGKGDAKARSDIDIFVDSQLKGLAFYGLLEDVVTSPKKDVDLIDRRELKAGSAMLDSIERNGIEICAS